VQLKKKESDEDDEVKGLTERRRSKPGELYHDNFFSLPQWTRFC
jgi:hypothetical protein